MKEDRWLYALTLSAAAAGIAGLLVPLYIVRLSPTPGAAAAALGVSAALSSLVGAPGAVLAGGYADRTGRRRAVVVVALAVGAVALSVLPFLRSVPAIIVVYAVLSFAMAAVSPVVTMLIVGDASESEWGDRIARLNVFQGYGATVGFVLGAVWTVTVASVVAEDVAQETLFCVAAVFGVASAVLALRSLPRESSLDVGGRRSGRIADALSRTARRVRDGTGPVGGNRIYWALRSLPSERIERLRAALSPVLLLYFAGATLFFTGFAVFWTPLPLYLTRLGFGSGTVFALYLVNNVASLSLFGVAGSVTGRYDLHVLQGSALTLRGTAFVGLGLVGTLGVGVLSGGAFELVLVAALLSLVGITWAFIGVAGTAIVSRHAPKRLRGSVLGLYAALGAVAGSVGSLLGGLLASRSPVLPFVVSGALVVTGALVVFGARRVGKSSTVPASTT